MDEVGDALAAAEYYKADHGSYRGLTVAALRRIDPGVRGDVRFPVLTTKRLCIEATVDGQTASATAMPRPNNVSFCEPPMARPRAC